MGLEPAIAPGRRRRPDWPRRLDDFIRERRSRPFAYGTNDCCTFALEGGVMAVTGVDLLPGIRRPTTERAAARFLLRRGHSDVAGLATELLGAPLSTPKLAQRGDVVAYAGVATLALGLCIGSVLACPGAAGLLFPPRRIATAAWRV